MKTLANNNKDVLILSNLIRNNLKNTNTRNLDLNSILQSDSLKRISNNFESIEVKYKGGYISISYKHTKTRQINNIQLTPKEMEMCDWKIWETRKKRETSDGEIRLAYGERFYHIYVIKINQE